MRAMATLPLLALALAAAPTAALADGEQFQKTSENRQDLLAGLAELRAERARMNKEVASCVYGARLCSDFLRRAQGGDYNGIPMSESPSLSLGELRYAIVDRMVDGMWTSKASPSQASRQVVRAIADYAAQGRHVRSWLRRYVDQYESRKRDLLQDHIKVTGRIREKERELAACNRELDEQVTKFAAQALAFASGRPSAPTRDDRIRRLTQLPAGEPDKPPGMPEYRGNATRTFALMLGALITLSADGAKSAAVAPMTLWVDREGRQARVPHPIKVTVPGVWEGRLELVPSEVDADGSVRGESSMPGSKIRMRPWRAVPLRGGREYKVYIGATPAFELSLVE